MRGDLVEKTAADVCRELAAQGASGILAIDGPGGPGRVVLVDGRIIAAVSPTPRARLGDRLVGAGELDPDDLANALAAQQDGGESLPLGSLLVEQGLVRRDAVRVFVQEQVLDALFEIIRWRYGAFAFDPDDGARGQGVPLSLSVDDALVEVARRQQEWRELSQVIPDLDSVPSFRTGGATATAALEPDEFAVLASVDGTRSVRALAADLGYGEFEAARIIYGLTLLGVVDVRPPQDEIGAALEDALGLGDFEELPAQDPAPPPAAEERVEPVTEAEPDTVPVDAPGDEPDAAPDDAPGDEPDAAPEDAPGVQPDETPDDLPEVPARDEAAPPELTQTPEAPDSEDTDEGLPEPAVGVTPPGSAQPSEDAGPGEDDVPEVWVSSPEDAEPSRPAAASDGHDQTAGQVVDAEVDLPPGSTASEPAALADDPEARPGQRRSGLGRGLAAIIPLADDLPEPDPSERQPDATEQRDDVRGAGEASDDDAPRWDDLAAAAEQAASDPESGRDAVASPQDRATPSAAPTTGPEPGSEVPPSPERSAPPPSERPSRAGDHPAPAAAPGQPQASDPDEDAAGTEGPAPSAPQRGDDNDVSEFLRELSRLSVDPPSKPSRPRPPTPSPPPHSPSADQDNKKKRRGLFGRG